MAFPLKPYKNSHIKRLYITSGICCLYDKVVASMIVNELLAIVKLLVIVINLVSLIDDNEKAMYVTLFGIYAEEFDRHDISVEVVVYVLYAIAMLV